MKNSLRFGKKIIIALILCASFLFAIFIFIQKKTSTLDGNRVALMDIVGSNYIFRGNSPLVTKDSDDYLAHDQLKAHFNQRLSEKGLPPLNDFYLVSVSLFNLNEYYLAKREREFFQQNPNLGEVVAISLIQPALLLSELDIPNLSQLMANQYHAWFTKKLKLIHSLALPVDSKPRVIYVHCYAGRDRTGMLAANYKMLFNKANSLKDIRLENIVEAGRHSRQFYDNSIRSYCEDLNRNYNRKLDCL
jgi:hypothetical protein